jgi:hypothetical protein
MTEWDVLTATTDAGVIWRRYRDGRLVIPGETRRPTRHWRAILPCAIGGNERQVNWTSVDAELAELRRLAKGGV